MKATQKDFRTIAPRAVREARVFFLCGQDDAGIQDAAQLLISPQLLQLSLSRGDDLQLLDVREANELEVCGLAQARNIPLGELDLHLHELDPERPLCLICYGGPRAERAAQRLLEAGFSRLQVLQGGLKAWARDIDPDMPLY